MATPIESNAAAWTRRENISFESGLPSSVKPGYGWGRTSNNHEGEVKDANISVDSGALRLEATNPNGGPPYHVGAVNTLGTVNFGPGTYVESRIDAIDLPGSLPAFWSKTQGDPERKGESGYTYPNGWNWPPEADFMEIVNNSGSSGTESTHHLHYSSSGNVGDGSTHKDYHAGNYSFGGNASHGWHTFGFLWLPDKIEYYVDSNRVGSCTDPDILSALENGAPYYIILWLGVGHSWPGSPPSGSWSDYDTVMSVDYVDVYDYTPEPELTEFDKGWNARGDDIAEYIANSQR